MPSKRTVDIERCVRNFFWEGRNKKKISYLVGWNKEEDESP